MMKGLNPLALTESKLPRDLAQSQDFERFPNFAYTIDLPPPPFPPPPPIAFFKILSAGLPTAADTELACESCQQGGRS